MGCPSGETPVDHRSASAVSRSSMPGSVGTVAPVTMPASWSAEPCATAPASQMAVRRPDPGPRAPSGSSSNAANAPEVASASSWASDSALRRATSSMSA